MLFKFFEPNIRFPREYNMKTNFISIFEYIEIVFHGYAQSDGTF